MTTKYLAKFQIPRAITRPKIIGPEPNVHLICNLSLYTHIPNIKSISQSIAVTTVLFRNYGMTDMGNTICPCHLVATTWIFFYLHYLPIIENHVTTNQYFLNDYLSLLKFAHKKNIEMWSYGEIFSIGVPICTLNSSNQDTGHI